MFILKAYCKQTTSTFFKPLNHNSLDNKLIYSLFNQKYTQKYLFSNQTIKQDMMFKQFQPKMKDSNVKYFYKQGKTLLQTKKIQKGLVFIQKAFERDPQNVDILCAAGIILMNNSQFQLGKNMLQQAIIQQPQNPRALILLSYSSSTPQSSLKYIKRFLQLKDLTLKQRKEARSYQIQLLKIIGSYQKSKQLLTHIQPSQNQRQTCALYSQRGQQLLYCKQYQLALKCFNKEYQIFQSLVNRETIPVGYQQQLVHQISTIHLQLQHIKQSLEYLTKLLQINPNHIQAMYYKMKILVHHKQQYQQSLKIIDRIQQLNKGYYDQSDGLKGICYKNLGKYEDALIYYNKYIQHPFNYSTKTIALEHRGQCYKKLQQQDLYLKNQQQLQECRLKQKQQKQQKQRQN